MGKTAVNGMPHDARSRYHGALPFQDAPYATQMPGTPIAWNRCGDAAAEGG